MTTRGRTTWQFMGLLVCASLCGIGEETTMNLSKYGFRYDPLKWTRTSSSLEAVMIRCSVLKTPNAGDRERIADELRKDLAERRKEAEKGELEAGNLDLMLVGAELNLPEVKAIGEFLLANAKPEEDGAFSTYICRALCHAGLGTSEGVRKAIEIRATKTLTENPWQCCPWGPSLKVIELWHGRDIVDTSKAMNHLVGILLKHTNPIGSIHDKDPWGMVEISGLIDHPKVKEMVVRMIPMILRAQRSDGSWKERAYHIFRALHRHGLLEPLTKLPPLPPDWQIVRSIPTPDGKMRAWLGMEPESGRWIPASSQRCMRSLRRMAKSSRHSL